MGFCITFQTPLKLLFKDEPVWVLVNLLRFSYLQLIHWIPPAITENIFVSLFICGCWYNETFELVILWCCWGTRHNMWHRDSSHCCGLLAEAGVCKDGALMPAVCATLLLWSTIALLALSQVCCRCVLLTQASFLWTFPSFSLSVVKQNLLRGS